MKLNITKQQFVILKQILEHVRLGNDNEFQSAVSDLAVYFDEVSTDQVSEKWPVPSVGITYSEFEGLVIELE